MKKTKAKIKPKYKNKVSFNRKKQNTTNVQYSFNNLKM